MTFEPDNGASSSSSPSWWRRNWDRVRSYRPARRSAETVGAPSSGGPASVTRSGRRRLWRWGTGTGAVAAAPADDSHLDAELKPALRVQWIEFKRRVADANVSDPRTITPTDRERPPRY